MPSALTDVDVWPVARRNSWGSIRRLPSGRYQARYRLDAEEFMAPQTFRTKRDAEAFLAGVRTDVERGAWVDPDAGRITLADYAWRWLDQRADLGPRTQELYESELRLHILPPLGQIELSALTTGRVRAWHAEILKADRPGRTTVAKCYRLLRTILSTAVEDEVIVKNLASSRAPAWNDRRSVLSPPSSRSTPWPK